MNEYMYKTILLDKENNDNNAILLKIINDKKHKQSKEKETQKHKQNILKFKDKSDKDEKKYSKKDKTYSISDIKDIKFEEDILIDIKCNNCKSNNIIIMNGFNICNDCGLYNDCIIDCGQEWRFYGNDDSKGNDPARCDVPTSELLPNTSIGSIVGFSSKDNKNAKRIRSMNFWNGFSYRDSSLLDTFNNITIMAQNAGISQCIIEEAKYMYKEVSEIKSSRRTKKEAMKAGCIMLACKLKGVPRNCNEIATIFKLKNNKTFRKSIKTFEEIWKNIKLHDHDLVNPTRKKSENNSETDVESESNNDEESNEESNEESDEESEYDTDNLKTIEKHNLTQDIVEINNNDNYYHKQDLSDNDDNDYHKQDLSDNETDDDDDDICIDTNKNIQECITKLHRFLCLLGLNDRVFEACKIILIYIENKKILEKHTPLSRTSTIIYYVIERLDITVNKHHILQTCEISQVTINKCYQKLMKYKTELENINIS